MTRAYLKSLGILARFTVSVSGGIYVGKILGIIFIVVKSFSRLDRLSEGGRDGPTRAVEGEDGSAPEDDACTPVDNPISDMTLSIIKLIKNSSTNFSIALNTSNIHTQGKQFMGPGTNQIR